MAKKKITKKPPKKKLSEKAVLPKQAAKKKFAAKTVTKNVAVKKTKVAPKRNVAPKSILAASGIVPPTGWMLIRRVDTGKDYWVDPNTVKDSAPGSPLTDEHKERIKRIVLALHEHYPSLESWYDGMSRELTPENEIQIWERRVAVYQDELADRPSSDAAELHLVYDVLVAASKLPKDQCSSGTVMSAFPKAKGLPNLDRVVNRMRGLMYQD